MERNNSDTPHLASVGIRVHACLFNAEIKENGAKARPHGKGVVQTTHRP